MKASGSQLDRQLSLPPPRLVREWSEWKPPELRGCCGTKNRAVMCRLAVETG